MHMRIPVYPAGPLGFSEAGRAFYYGTFLPMLVELGYEPRDPWTLTPETAVSDVEAMPYGEAKREAWRKLNITIGENNRNAIVTSRLVVAILDGPDVDSGTAAEIGYAAGRDIPIIGYRGDFRISADNVGAMVNLQVEHFIRRNGGTIVQTMNDLRRELKRWHPLLSHSRKTA